MRYDAALGPGPRDCESSGVRNTVHSHGERNDQIAFPKRVPGALGDYSTIPPETDGALGPEPRRFCMSLWQKPGSQGRVSCRTHGFFFRYHRDLLDALYVVVGPWVFRADVT